MAENKSLRARCLLFSAVICFLLGIVTWQYCTFGDDHADEFILDEEIGTDKSLLPYLFKFYNSKIQASSRSCKKERRKFNSNKQGMHFRCDLVMFNRTAFLVHNVFRLKYDSASKDFSVIEKEKLREGYGVSLSSAGGNGRHRLIFDDDMSFAHLRTGIGGGYVLKPCSEWEDAKLQGTCYMWIWGVYNDVIKLYDIDTVPLEVSLFVSFVVIVIIIRQRF
jgi:hypothetical protein